MSDVQEPVSTEVSENIQEIEEPTLDSEVQDLVSEIEKKPEEEVFEEESEEAESAEEKAIQELKKKLMLKVDGEEIEEELDWNDDESLKRHIQKSKAFDKRAKEYATLRSQVEALITDLQNNPAEVLAKLGHNVDEIAEKHLQSKIEEMKKTPEQLEREKMQTELEKLRKENEDKEKRIYEAKMEKMRNEYATEIENDIVSALENPKSTLPESPYVVKRVAETMLLAMQNGYNDVKAADVLPLVEQQIRNELQQLFGKLPEDVLEQVIGKSNLDRMRKKRLKTHKTATETAKQITQETGQETLNKEEPLAASKTYRDFFNFNE